MTLNGYEVYHFWGKELYAKDDKNIEKMIKDFFDMLFEKYKLIKNDD